MIAPLKFCPNCKQTLPREQFARTKKGWRANCYACHAAKARERYAAQRNDPAFVQANRDRANRWRLNNPERNRAAKRLSYSGWTAEQFENAWQEQEGKCAICKCLMTPQGIGKAAVAADHCHETGQRRGLLCQPCNAAIGTFRDDPALLRAAADYLERCTKL